MKNTPPSPAILYHNERETIFLVDIPTSIALAQELSLNQQHQHQQEQEQEQQQQHHHSHPSRSQKPTQLKRVLLSNTPPTTPYTTPEPKTSAARNRVLQRIPPAERIYHGEVIAPVVCRALRELREGLGEGEGEGVEWCLERWVPSVTTISSGEGDGDGDEPAQQGHSRKRRRAAAALHEDCQCVFQGRAVESVSGEPPLILSPGPGVNNAFASGEDVTGVLVRNTSAVEAVVRVGCTAAAAAAAAAAVPTTRNGDRTGDSGNKHHHTYTIPASSTFLLTHLPLSQQPTTSSHHYDHPIPSLPATQKFNLILLDPPWTNRSVHRSGHYHTQAHTDSQNLTQYMQSLLQAHLLEPSSSSSSSSSYSSSKHQNQNQNKSKQAAPTLAAIWTTNSAKARAAAHTALAGAGLTVVEEWIWVKITTAGEPVSPVDALWRKPYEVLVVGRVVFPVDDGDDGVSVRASRLALDGESGDNHDDDRIKRRVIVAVPDVHSRKPNLRELFERVFFGECEYAALEVFARHLTAGWWACGDEVVRFNEGCWWCLGNDVAL